MYYTKNTIKTLKHNIICFVLLQSTKGCCSLRTINDDSFFKANGFTIKKNFGL